MPGHLKGNTVLLPNGWKISPAGKHIQLDDLPMEMLESPDGRYLIVTNNGYSKPILDIVDLQHLYIKDRVSIENAWLGLAWNPTGERLYASLGGKNAVGVFDFKKAGLESVANLDLPHKEKDSFVAGISVNPDGSRLYAVQVFENTLTMLDTSTGKEVKTVALDAEPYTTLLTADG